MRCDHSGSGRTVSSGGGQTTCRELAGSSLVAVVLGQPLTADDERSLTAAAAASGARLLALPRVADVGPSGIPPEVLVRAVQASLPRLATPAGPALLVPLSLVPEPMLLS